MRITFEATLDEAVDVQVRIMRHNEVSRFWRRRAKLTVGLMFALAITVLFVVSADAAGLGRTTYLAGGALCATVFGFLAAFFYGAFYDATILKRLRLYGRSQYGDDPYLCEIELRPEGAWGRHHGTEWQFAWSTATAVEDTVDAIEIRFKGGMVIARNRAFTSPADRERFFDQARALAQL